MTGGTNTDTDALARRLWDVHEIQQLAYRFAHAHDSRDMAEIEAIFVPATEPLTFPEFNQANALARLREYFAFAGPTVLFVTNHTIEFINDDHATGRVYCFAKLSLGDAWVEQAIQYHDVYARHEGRWRFERRRHLLWYGIELPERPYDQPKTQWPSNATGRGSLPEEFASWRDFYGILEAPTGYYSQPQDETVAV